MVSQSVWYFLVRMEITQLIFAASLQQEAMGCHSATIIQFGNSSNLQNKNNWQVHFFVVISG